MGALYFPDWLNPVAFSIGPWPIYWYGIAYSVGLLIGFWLMRRWFSEDLPWDRLGDRIVLVIVVGIVVGGRMGYALWYGWDAWREDFSYVWRIREGGMSFHGACVGVVLAVAGYARWERLGFWRLMDRVVMVVPPGLFLGRLTNFVNAELVGKITDVPWGVVFPGAGPWPRHPSQLYEAIGEGLLLGWLMFYLGKRRGWIRTEGFCSGLFAMAYGVIRCVMEYWRAPDPQLGLRAWGLQQGQWLSVGLILVGASVWWWSQARSKRGAGHG